MMNNGILSPVKQGKLPDSNTPPQIALMKPKTIVTLDFSKDSGDTPNIIQVKSVKTEAGAQDREKDESQEKRDKKAEIARVLKVIKDVQVVKRGPGRPKSPGRSKVPKVIHSKGGVDFSGVTSIAKGADILSKEKIVVLPSRSQDEPLDMSRKGGSEMSKRHPMGSPPPPVSLDDISKWRPEMNFEQRLQFLNYVQKFYVEKQIEEQQEKDIDDTIDSVIKKSVREVDGKRSEFERLQAELSGEASPMEKLYKAPHTQLMESWRVSHISETFSPSMEFSDREKSGRDSPDVSDGFPSFYSSPWRRGRPPKKPRGRPRGSGLLRGSPFGKESSPVKFSSPYRRVGRPPLYLKGLSPRGRPRGRSPGRPRLSGGSPGRPRGSGGSPGRPRGSGGSPRGHSPGRPRLSDYSPGHSPRPGRPRGRPRGRSPRSRSPRGGSPRGGSPRAIMNINFDNNPVSPSESDIEANDNDTGASPAYKPPYEEMEPESPVQENVSESPPRVTPPPERAPTPKVLTETISETPIPAEIITIPIKQEVIEESKETVPDRDRQDSSTDRQSSESRQSSVSRQDSKQDVRDPCVSLKKVEEEQEHRKMYIDARRRSSDEWRVKEESVDKDEERKERKSVERKDKHGEERKERHKEHSHSKDRERSKVGEN